MKHTLAVAGLLTGLSLALPAQPAVFVVDALANSSNSGAGTGLDTVLLDLGDLFTVTAGIDDLWSAGALPR